MAEGEVVPFETAVMRALCLSAYVWRANAEAAFVYKRDERELAMWRQVPDVVDRWVTGAELMAGMSPMEKLRLSVPPGQWAHQEVLDGCWRGEALGVILWALGRIEAIPPYDREVEFTMLYNASFIPNTLPEALAIASMRPPQDILHARDVAELWHWRQAETVMLRHHIPWPAGHDPEATHRRAAEAAFANRDAPPPIRGDFPALGKAYRDLNDQEFAIVTSIAVERHFGLNWLCGYSDSWEDTPTDT